MSASPAHLSQSGNGDQERAALDKEMEPTGGDISPEPRNFEVSVDAVEFELTPKPEIIEIADDKLAFESEVVHFDEACAAEDSAPEIAQIDDEIHAQGAGAMDEFAERKTSGVGEDVEKEYAEMLDENADDLQENLESTDQPQLNEGSKHVLERLCKLKLTESTISPVEAKGSTSAAAAPPKHLFLSCTFNEKVFIDDPLVGPNGTNLPRDTLTHFLELVEIESPSKFYVRTQVGKEEIDYLQKQMTEFYDGCIERLNPVPVQDIKLKGYYAMKFPLSGIGTWVWVRVYVYKSSESGDAYVYLIDHGVKIPDTLEGVYPLRKAFCAISAGAIPARMYTLDPASVWTDYETNIFKADTKGQEFSVLVIDRQPNTVEPYEILGVILICLGTGPDNQEEGGKIYSFRGRYEFCYNAHDFQAEMTTATAGHSTLNVPEA